MKTVDMQTEFDISPERIDEITTVILRDIEACEDKADQLIAEARGVATVESAHVYLDQMNNLLKKRISFEKDLFIKVAENTKINLAVLPFINKLVVRLSR